MFYQLVYKRTESNIRTGDTFEILKCPLVRNCRVSFAGLCVQIPILQLEKVHFRNAHRLLLDRATIQTHPTVEVYAMVSTCFLFWAKLVKRGVIFAVIICKQSDAHVHACIYCTCA